MLEWVDEIDRGLSRAERVRSLGRDAAEGAAGAQRGFAGLRQLGLQARRNQTVVGGHVYHTVSDREHALAQLMNDYLAFTNDCMAGLTPQNEPWFRNEVTPVLDEWLTFRENELAAWLTRWATDWSTFERWHDRLVLMRRTARTHGFKLTSPDPAALPRTVWERGSLGVGSKLDAFWTLIRTIAYSLAGLIGLWSIVKVYQELRGPQLVDANA